jgi:hypothetical protein
MKHGLSTLASVSVTGVSAQNSNDLEIKNKKGRFKITDLKDFVLQHSVDFHSFWANVFGKIERLYNFDYFSLCSCSSWQYPLASLSANEITRVFVLA